MKTDKRTNLNIWLAISVFVLGIGHTIAAGEIIHIDPGARATLANMPKYAPDQVVFKLVAPGRQRGGRAIQVQQLFQQVARKHRFDQTAAVFADATPGPLKHVYLVDLPADVSPIKACKKLEADPAVEWAEPHYYRYTQQVTPNDPCDCLQWHLPVIGAPTAWDVTTGSSDIVIAIIDTGVDWGHPDLEDNIWRNTDEIEGDGIDNDENGFVDDIRGWDFVSVDPCEVYPGEDPGPPDNDPMDFYGHGTHVAGIAASVGNNGLGVVGISWNSKIMPLRAGYRSSCGCYGWLESVAIADALVYAADNGADIVNMSFGGYEISRIEREAIDYCAAAGVLLIAATGNDATDKPLYPAAFDSVVAVAGTDEFDVRYAGSNYGVWVDLAAPGDSIFSTLIGGKYGYKTGTSMASPVVAGVAALIKSIRPLWSVDRIVLQLNSTATSVNDQHPQFINNFVNLLGAGRVAADQALTTAEPPAKLGVVGLWVEYPADNGNGEPDSNETIELWTCVKNFATAQSGVSVQLQTADPYLTVLDDTSLVGDIGQKRTGMLWNDPMTILIDHNVPGDHIASLSLEVSTNEAGVLGADVMKLRLNPLLSDPQHIVPHTNSTDFIEPKLLLKPGGGTVLLCRSRLEAETDGYQVYARSADLSGNWGPVVRISHTSAITYADKYQADVSTTGRVHVSFRGIVAEWDAEIFYTSQDPIDQTWSPPVQLTTNAEIFTFRIDGENAIGVDSQDHPHIVWVDCRNGQAELYYMHNDGTGWSPETVITTPPGNPFWISQLHLIFDSEGTGYLLWRQSDDQSIYMMILKQGIWSSPQLVTTTSDLSYYFSVGLDSQNQLHLVYGAPTADDVSYRRYDGTTWSNPEAIMDTYVSDSTERPVIAIGPDDQLHVVRRAQPYFSEGQSVSQIYETVYDGTSWSCLTQVTFGRSGTFISDIDYAISESGTRLFVGSLDTDPSFAFGPVSTRDIVLLTSDLDPARLPSRPTVTDEGATTNNPISLHASWSSSHSSGIAEYKYGVGTVPGEADLRYWTSVDTETSATIDLTDTPLVAGQAYYVSVRARNTIGYYSLCGCSDGIIYQPAGDLDNDYDVDMADFARFAMHWLKTDCGKCSGTDLTGDGQVTMDDLREFTGNWLAGVK